MIKIGLAFDRGKPVLAIPLRLSRGIGVAECSEPQNRRAVLLCCGSRIPVAGLGEISKTFERRGDDILCRGRAGESFGSDCPPIFDHESRILALKDLKRA